MSCRSWSIVAVMFAGTACRGGPPRAAIALSYPAWARPYAEVAESLAAGGATRLPAIVVDDADSSETTVRMVRWAQRLSALDSVVGVVGPSGSRVALATAPIYNAAGIPQVVPSATSRLLRQAGPWTFTLAPDDSVEGAFIARYLASVLHVRRVILFYANDEFGQGLRQAVRASLARSGVEFTAELAVSVESDFEPLLAAALRRGHPDAIVMAARDRETGTVAALAARLAPGVPIVASDGALRPGPLARFAGAALGNIRAVSFWMPDTADARIRRFIRIARARNGQPPDADAAMVQDAIALMAAAVADVGPDRSAIREWLRSLGRERPPFPGLTGPITFGGPAAPRLWMARIANGNVVPDTAR
jgi:branched-chain amino acid transport system substrate-binding protein